MLGARLPRRVLTLILGVALSVIITDYLEQIKCLGTVLFPGDGTGMFSTVCLSHCSPG